MKRTVKILSLSLALVMLVFVFASCSGGNIDDYAKKLREKGYDVDYADIEDLEDMSEELNDIGLFGYSLVACMTAEADYDLYDDYDEVMIMEFQSSSKAKEFVKDVREKGLLDFFDENIESKGALVFIGTDKAMEDALGK